jgi:hypothetical protein
MPNASGSAHASSSLLAVLISMLALSGVLPALAQGEGPETKLLYQWTDAAGQVHFSDRPPVGAVDGVRVQEVSPFRAPPAAQGAVDYSVESQAKRLAEDRTAREAAREEARRQREEQALREAQLEAAKAQVEAARAQRDAAEHDGPGGYPVFVRPQPPWWPSTRPPYRVPPGWGGGKPLPAPPVRPEPKDRLRQPKLWR